MTFQQWCCIQVWRKDYGIPQLLVDTGSCVQGTERVGLQRVERVVVYLTIDPIFFTMQIENMSDYCTSYVKVSWFLNKSYGFKNFWSLHVFRNMYTLKENNFNLMLSSFRWTNPSQPLDPSGMSSPPPDSFLTASITHPQLIPSPSWRYYGIAHAL